MNQQARWLARDFVFAAPVGFPHVVALEPERFVLRPSTEERVSPRLFVFALPATADLQLDQPFPAIAANILRWDDPVDWSIGPG
jgi:hypothetical protein